MINSLNTIPLHSVNLTFTQFVYNLIKFSISSSSRISNINILSIMETLNKFSRKYIILYLSCQWFFAQVVFTFKYNYCST